MDQMLSYSKVNHASTNLPFAIIPPVLSRVDPHQRTHQTWDLPLARHANPGPVVPAPHAQAVLATAAPDLQQSHPTTRQGLNPTVKRARCGSMYLELKVLGNSAELVQQWFSRCDSTRNTQKMVLEWSCFSWKCHDMSMLNQGSSWRCSPGHRQKRPRWAAHSLVHSGGMWAAGSAVCVWMLAAVPQTKGDCRGQLVTFC